MVDTNSSIIIEQDAAPVYTWFTFTWVNPLFDRALIRATDGELLKQSDLLWLPSFENPQHNAEVFNKYWSEELKLVAHATNTQRSVSDNDPTTINNNSNNNSENNNNNKHEKEKVVVPSIVRALRRSFWPRVVVSGILRILGEGANFGTPFVLQQYILWLQGTDDRMWLGALWCIGITLCGLLGSWLLNLAMHHSLTAFTQMSNALQVTIYEKILTLHPEHGRTGHLTSVHASDSKRIAFMGPMLHSLWVSPLFLLGTIAALWYFIGYSGLIAIGIMVVTTPLQGILMRRLMTFRIEGAKISDQRVSTINEALQGIRICKFMGWEERFEAKIAVIRGQELVLLRKSYLYRAIITVIATALPNVIAFILFALAYVIDGELKPQSVFPALALINAVRMPMVFIPIAVALAFETKVSLDRIRRVLLAPNVNPYVVIEGDNGAELINVTVMPTACLTDVKGGHGHGHGGHRGPPLAAKDKDNNSGKDGGNKNTPILFNVTCKFPAGALTVVHGPTGSGKSTLVKALIGEANIQKDEKGDTGVVRVGGSVAYLSQEAWIMNATVRDNILVGAVYDAARYNMIIEACQLVEDFIQLSDGDMTEIGERGVNLSGGQKQRVAFARAAYSDRDIVIMDDPLSAVDAHVSRKLFDCCIVGLMAGKTRILITHQVQLLQRCDNMIEIRGGKVFYEGLCNADIVMSKMEASDDVKSNSGSDGQEASELADLCPNEKKTAITDTADTTDAADCNKKLMSDENMAKGSVSWSVYWWYARMITYRWVLLTLLFFSMWRVTTVIADLWVAWWSSHRDAFGRSFTNNEYLLYFGITVAISVVMLYLRQVMFTFSVIKSSQLTHARMAHRLLHAPTSFFDTTPMGRILNRFTKDMDGLDYQIPESVGFILNTGFMLLGTLALIIISAWYIIIIVPFLLIYLRIILKRYTCAVRPLKQLEGISRSPVMAIVNETLGGLSTIRAYGLVEMFRRAHSQRAIVSARAPYVTRCAQRWLSARTELAAVAVLFCVTYLAVVLRAADVNTVSPAIMALAVTYISTTTNSLTFLNRSLAEFEAEMSSAERVREYCEDVPQESSSVVLMPTNADIDEHETQPQLIVVAKAHVESPPPDWGTKGAVSFEDVSLRYRPGLDLVLKGVNMNVAAGTKVGIVGRTGSGKSTLILSMFRMVELASGRIILDGRDIAQVPLKDLRARITVIPQDPVLFVGTLRSNLDPFSTHSDDEVWKVLDKCGMKHRVGEASEGLESAVTERGNNFSVGQRQLLCLARALLKRTSLLLLDEATASVDFESDACIQEVIRTEFAESTVITIAHRLVTIMDSDMIVVMSDGVVAEHGTPTELLSDGGSVFSSMLRQLGPEKCAELRQRVLTSNTK